MLLGGADNEQRAVEAEFNKQADLMMSMFGDSLTDAQKSYGKGILYQMLAGEDGILDSGEIKNLGIVFLSQFQSAMRNGIENTEFGNIGAAFLQEFFSEDQ